MKNYFLFFYFVTLILLGCLPVKRLYVLTEIDCDRAIDSLEREIIKKNVDYIFYMRSISTWFNSNTYLIVKDTINYVYKINRFGVYLYISPTWYNEGMGHLIERFDSLQNDSIKVGNNFYHHAPSFNLECRAGKKTFTKMGKFYQLKEEQPIYRLISRLESDLLNAEQDKFYWRKVR